MKSDGHRRQHPRPDCTQIGAGFARGSDYGTCYVQVIARHREDAEEILGVVEQGPVSVG